MRAADEAKLRSSVGVFPDDGVAGLDALELGVVDDVDLRVLRNYALALLDGLGGEVFNVV